MKLVMIACTVVLATVFATAEVEAKGVRNVENPTNTVGLKLFKTGAFEGYTLLAPPTSTTVYLIDMLGREVHRWETGYRPGLVTYLLNTGHLLRTVKIAEDAKNYPRDGKGGMVQKIDWDGNVVWSYNCYTDNYLSHHDVEPLPNGNVLIIAWERKSEAEAIAPGRDPSKIAGYFSPDKMMQMRGRASHQRSTSVKYLLPEKIIEVQPIGRTGGKIVWEWHAWDHLVQDFDPTKENYGVVADHPELINLNYVSPTSPDKTDWLHLNAIDYNATLDQIIITCHSFSEIWIIAHSTTTVEAAGHTGGKSGKGGDLLYRWGNPAAYDAGSTGDQMLYYPHDAHWIESGLPGEGHVMIFNNGLKRTPTLNYSSVDEIELPVDNLGNYTLQTGRAYGPDELFWTYVADDPKDFYSRFISGAQRLANGNTLICCGRGGNIFEVTKDGKTVWHYINPVAVFGPLTQGDEVPVGKIGPLNLLFRAYRYAPDYPAFSGKKLTPKSVIEKPAGSGKSLTHTTDGPTDLTAKQKKAYSAIIEEFRAKRRNVFRQAPGDRQKVGKAMAVLAQEQHKQMRSLLNDEQFEQYKDWMAQQRRQRQNR